MPTMLKRWLSYVAKLWSQPHWWAESWSSWVIVGWAVSNLIDRSLEHAAFASLVDLAPVWVWIYGALFVGLFQMLALLLNNRILRAVAAFFCAWLMAIILIHFALSGVGIPASMALYCGYFGINLMAMYKLIRGTA